MDQSDFDIVACQLASGTPTPSCCGGSTTDEQAGYSFYLDDDRLALRLGDASCNAGTFRSVPLPALASQGWHHVAVSVDRDHPAGGRFFLDGAPVAAEAGGASFDPTPVSGDAGNFVDLRIGADHASPPNRFSGKLDEIELFPRKLADGEIDAVHAADACGKCWRRSQCIAAPLTDVCVDRADTAVPVLVCNDTAEERSYDLGAAPLPAGSLSGFCTVAGPTAVSFHGRLSGPNRVSVEPGQCRRVFARATRPAWLDSPGETSCLSVTIEDTSTGETSSSTGAIRARDCSGFDVDVFDPQLFALAPGDLGAFGAQVNARGFTLASFVLRHAGGGLVPYEVSATTPALPGQTPVGLGGLAPGTPLTGTLDLAAGVAQTLSFDVSFSQQLDHVPHFLSLRVDPENDGSFEEVSSAVLVSRIPASPCPEAIDVDADGDLDEDDGSLLASALGTSTGDPGFVARADLDHDEQVSAADQAIWAACHGRFTGNPTLASDPPVGPVPDPGDLDLDGVPDVADLCPYFGNPDQADADGDGQGDACDPCVDDPANDADTDGVCADADACPDDPFKTEPGVCGCGQSDSDFDADGLPDCIDDCIEIPNTEDVDGDGIPDCPASEVPALGDGAIWLCLALMLAAAAVLYRRNGSAS